MNVSFVIHHSSISDSIRTVGTVDTASKIPYVSVWDRAAPREPKVCSLDPVDPLQIPAGARVAPAVLGEGSSTATLMEQ